MSTINQRLKLVINLSGKQSNEVARDIEVTDQQLSNWINNTKPSVDGLKKIIQYFPDIDARWLMTGDGEMIIKKDNNNSGNTGMCKKDVDELKDLIKDLNISIKELKLKGYMMNFGEEISQLKVGQNSFNEIESVK